MKQEKKKFKDSFRTEVQVRYRENIHFSQHACFHSYSTTTKHLEVKIIEREELTKEEILEYIRRIKVIFPFVIYSVTEEGIIVTLKKERFNKPSYSEYAYSKIPLFMIRFLWENLTGFYNLSFIKEFLADTRRIDTLKKFCIHHNNNRKKDSEYNTNHSIGHILEVMTKKQLQAKKCDLVTNYFKKEKSKFKTIVH